MGCSIWATNNCGADTVIDLINNGMDLYEREPLRNETVLHYWAGMPFDEDSSRQEDSLAVVKLIVEKGADLLAVNCWGFTPLLEAANGRNGRCPNLAVLDFLLERVDYNRVDKIEAMELTGAVILGNPQNSLSFHKAFDYWRRALQIRQPEVEGGNLIKKPLSLNLKTVRASEWITSAELENVIDHPETYMIQSFLLRLRIFSYKRRGAIESLFGFYFGIFRFPDLWISKISAVEIFEIIWAMLETVCCYDPGETPKLQYLTERIIYQLVEVSREVFSSLERESPDFCSGEIIKTSLELILSATGLHRVHFDPLIQLVKMLFRLPPMLNKAEALNTLSTLRNHFGQNLLHVACFQGDRYYGDHYLTIRILLNIGCDPNAVDQDGNTSLHYLSQFNQPIKSTDLNMIARLLLDFGAQPSLKNSYGKTVVDLLIRKNERKRPLSGDEDQKNIGWKLPDWCSELPTLKCLSAGVIRCNRIPYSKLPTTLITMLEQHKIIK